MGIGLREWLIIAGVIIIIGILIHGYWRSERIKHKRRDNENSDADLFENAAVDHQSQYSDNFTVAQQSEQESFGVDEPFISSLEPESSEIESHQSNPMMAEPHMESDIITKPKKRIIRRKKSKQIQDEEAIEQAANQVLVMNLIVKEGEAGFFGPDLLQAVLACGMRFGDMDIFHRHEGATGEGPIQFSMANAVEPGTFDIENIEHFSTPGITFFLNMAEPENVMQAFDLMVETIQYLVDQLGGVVKDDQRNPMTVQMFEHYRERIYNFERQKLSHQN